MAGEEPEKTEDVEMAPEKEEEAPEETEEKKEEEPAPIPEPDPVKEYEEEFKDRFTEKDELYTATANAEPTPPPVITNWSSHDRYGRHDRESGDDRNRKNQPELKIPGYYQFIY